MTSFENTTSGERLNARQPMPCLRGYFEFSIIGWERRIHSGGSSWAFKYESSDVRWDPTASRFKTHTGLKEYLRLKEERQ